MSFECIMLQYTMAYYSSVPALASASPACAARPLHPAAKCGTGSLELTEGAWERKRSCMYKIPGFSRTSLACVGRTRGHPAEKIQESATVVGLWAVSAAGHRQDWKAGRLLYYKII